jgi:hypothetical protein
MKFLGESFKHANAQGTAHDIISDGISYRVINSYFKSRI